LPTHSRGTAYKIGNAASNLPPAARPLPAETAGEHAISLGISTDQKVGVRIPRARFPHLTSGAKQVPSTHVRIRELVTLVIGPGGEVRVDGSVFEFAAARGL
jgi:hypothetical protein